MKKFVFILFIFININVFSQFRQNVYVVTDENAQFYKNMPVGSIIYNKSKNRAYKLNVAAISTDNLAGISNKTSYPMGFNGNRTVKRAGLPQVNAGGDDLFEWIENYFFPFVNPSISINGNLLYEIGTNNAITISGGITMHDETALTNGHLDRVYPSPTVTVETFGTAISYTASVNYNPRQTPSNVNEQHQQKYIAYTTGIDCSCTIHSGTKYVRAVYPYLYGLSDSNLETGGDLPYTNLNKLVQLQGNKSVLLTGNGFVYFCYPATYPDLTSILDQNGFEQITAFTKYTADIKSTGLVSNWTVSYKIYKLNNTTSANSWVYQFKY